MVEGFGETIFRLSHNHQLRRGDPIRLKDFAAIERQRADLGLSDAEISERIGLSRDQVTFIRNLVERRKIRHNHYQRLLELGGGRRFRAERFTPHEQRHGYSEAAMNLRDAMRFDGDRAAMYLERGWWSPADTLSRWLEKAASETPDAPAIIGGGQSMPYRELAGRVAALAGGLKALGLGSGDVVAVQLPNRAEYLVSYLAICAIGGVMTTLYVPYRAAEMETLLVHSRAPRLHRSGRHGRLQARPDRARPAEPHRLSGACHRPRGSARQCGWLRQSSRGPRRSLRLRRSGRGPAA